MENGFMTAFENRATVRFVVRMVFGFGLMIMAAASLSCAKFEQDNQFDTNGTNWHPPELKAMSDTTVRVGDKLRLWADAHDDNGYISDYEWRFSDGSIVKTNFGRLDTVFYTAGENIVMVRACDNDGIPSQNDTIKILVYTLVPLLVAPQDGFCAVTKTISLSWIGPQRAIYYSVLLDTMQKPSTVAALHHTTVTFNAMFYVDYGRTYYWRIVGHDSTGQSDTSTVRSFKTPQPPSLPIIAQFPVRYLHRAIVFGDQIFIVANGDGTYSSDVWKSSDGITWQLCTANAGFSGRVLFSLVTFNNMLWLYAGQTYSGVERDIWKSSDGVTWQQVTSQASFGQRWMHGTVLFKNKLWLIGGRNYDNNLNDIWTSTDGFSWSCVVTNASFAPRSDHATLVYNDKIWVIGGCTTNPRGLNDVWYSSDGLTWTRATENAFARPRRNLNAVVYNNAMWVIGGIDSTTILNDIYKSTDGVTWTRCYPSPAIPPLEGTAAVAFDNRIWVIAGSARSTTGWPDSSTNKIWYFKE